MDNFLVALGYFGSLYVFLGNKVVVDGLLVDVGSCWLLLDFSWWV